MNPRRRVFTGRGSEDLHGGLQGTEGLVRVLIRLKELRRTTCGGPGPVGLVPKVIPNLGRTCGLIGIELIRDEGGPGTPIACVPWVGSSKVRRTTLAASVKLPAQDALNRGDPQIDHSIVELSFTTSRV